MIKRCAICGSKMRLVTVKQGRRFYGEFGNTNRRKIQRWECTSVVMCDYKETPFNNDRERLIADGVYDEEIGIIKSL